MKLRLRSILVLPIVGGVLCATITAFLTTANLRAAGNGPLVSATAAIDQSNKYVTPDGRAFSGPPLVDGPVQYVGKGKTLGVPGNIPPEADTGAFRRVFSKPGYSFLRARVHLPCGAANFLSDAQQDFEVGYVYTGGWGATTTGAAIDAGFQRSSAQAAVEAYSLFIAFKGKMYYSDGDRTRYRCDQDVALEFFPSSKTRVRLNADGVDVNGSPSKQRIEVSTSVSDGWWPSGGGGFNGVILKRMTTIAQPRGWHAAGASNGKPWNQDGAYFGHKPGTSDPLVKWADCQIGLFDAAGHRQTETWSHRHTFRRDNYPSDGHRVLVTFTDDANEADALDLHG